MKNKQSFGLTKYQHMTNDFASRMECAPTVEAKARLLQSELLKCRTKKRIRMLLEKQDNTVMRATLMRLAMTFGEYTEQESEGA